MTDLASTHSIGATTSARARARARGAVVPERQRALHLRRPRSSLFALWVPDTFLTSGVWRSLLANSALTALVAIAVTIPLAAGVFNLAVGTEVGMAAILSAWLLERAGHSASATAILLTLAAGCAIGAVSGALIVRARIDSFIATLGMSSVLLALIAWVSGGQQILNLPASFQALATNELLGLAYPVWIMLAVGLRRLVRHAAHPDGSAAVRHRRQRQRRPPGRRADVARDRAGAGELRRDRGAGRAADERPAGGRRPDRRPGLPAARLRRRVPRARPSSTAAGTTSGAPSSRSSSWRSGSRASSWPARRSGSPTSSTASRCCSPSACPSTSARRGAAPPSRASCVAARPAS